MCAFLQHETIYYHIHSEQLEQVCLSLQAKVSKNTGKEQL